MVGNTRVDARINDHLSAMGRISLNWLTQLRETHRAYSSQKYAKGYYGRQDISSTEVNADFLLTYKNSFGNDFKYEIVGGGNHMSYVHRDVMSSVNGLVIPEVYNLANGINNPQVKTNDALKQINSFYGMGSLSWKNRIFLDLTGRNDWSSTLPAGNNSYFYPSVTTSLILSDLINLPQRISYLKYRLSYAQVGSDASPYQTAKYYSQSSFPSSAVIAGSLYNTALKPEITATWETGFDLKLFDNRLGLDLTYYTGNTQNQILSVPADIVTGYGNRIINAGKITNKGVEAILSGTPVKNKNVEWNVMVNWSTNQNRIVSLVDNVEQQTLASLGGAWIGYIIATKGGTTSDLWGPKMLRDEKGNIINANGVPTYTSTNEYIGRTTPDWKAGITNTVRYRNMRLTATIDGQYKGLIKSGSHQRASWAGTTASTLPGRDEGTIVGPGVMDDGTGKYVPNNVAVKTETYYVGYYSKAADVSIFDASFIKIRELAVSYVFPKSRLGHLPVQNLALSLYGRNLAVFDKYPWFDPEAGMQNGQIFIQGVEMTPMPLTASYGFNVKVDF
jgi:outer membrane receptor protein involved in Fe transport